MTLLVRAIALLSMLHGGGPECERDPLATLRRARESYVVAVATPDTVPVAPPAGAGAAAGRRLAGQVVRVYGVVGPGARSTSSPGVRAVFVPWATGEDCRRVPWTSSARWLAPGSRVLLVAVLRSGGGSREPPVYDVELADRQPYPAVRSLAWDAEGPLLPVDSLPAFLGLLPTDDDTTDLRTATAALWRWARAHPALARREPASFLLSSLCNDLLREEWTTTTAPFAGTYRLAVTLTGEPVRSVLAVTGRSPADVANVFGAAPHALYCASGTAPPARWDVLVAPATPGPGSSARPGRPHSGSLTVKAPRGAGGARFWPAELDPTPLEEIFSSAGAYHAFIVSYEVELSRSTRGERPSRGGFSVTADGSVSFEQVIRLRDGRTLTFSGKRISGETLH